MWPHFTVINQVYKNKLIDGLSQVQFIKFSHFDHFSMILLYILNNLNFTLDIFTLFRYAEIVTGLILDIIE